jgi:hypothetical protein
MTELVLLIDELSDWGKFYIFYTLVIDVKNNKKKVNDETEGLSLTTNINNTDYIRYAAELLSNLLSTYDFESITAEKLVFIADKVICPFLAFYRKMKGYPPNNENNQEEMQCRLIEIYDVYINPFCVQDIYEQLDDENKFGIVRLFIIDLAIEFITIALSKEMEVARILNLTTYQQDKRIFTARTIIEKSQPPTLKKLTSIFRAHILTVYMKHIKKEIENLGKMMTTCKRKSNQKILCQALKHYKKTIHLFNENIK